MPLAAPLKLAFQALAVRLTPKFNFRLAALSFRVTAGGECGGSFGVASGSEVRFSELFFCSFGTLRWNSLANPRAASRGARLGVERPQPPRSVEEPRFDRGAWRVQAVTHCRDGEGRWSAGAPGSRQGLPHREHPIRQP